MHFLRRVSWAAIAAIFVLAAFRGRGIDALSPLNSADKSDEDVAGYWARQQADAVAAIRALSDAELQTRLNESPDGMVIAEVLRRGGARWHDALTHRTQDALDELRRKSANEPGTHFGSNLELRLQSASAQIQGRPAPATVMIDGEQQLDLTWPDMPIFSVKIVNTDENNRRLDWSEGGNYRHGRRESFSFDVVSSQGTVMPIVYPTSMEGGILSFVSLEKGEAWTANLSLRSYVMPLPPGEYSVRCAYAFGAYIGTVQDKSDEFVLLSAPVKLVIHPREVVVTKRDRNAVGRLLQEWNPTRPVKLVIGTYDADSQRAFIDPESVPAKLFSLGWPAVPPLIQALHEDGISELQRAWLFAILYSITSANDPRGTHSWERSPDGLLGSFEYIDPGWSALAKNQKGEVEGGRGFSRGSAGGTIDPAAQYRFARRWQRTLQYMVVKEKD